MQKGDINKLRPRPSGHHLAHDIFKCIFLNEKVSIPIKILLDFVPINHIKSSQRYEHEY